MKVQSMNNLINEMRAVARGEIAPPHDASLPSIEPDISENIHLCPLCNTLLAIRPKTNPTMTWPNDDYYQAESYCPDCNITTNTVMIMRGPKP